MIGSPLMTKYFNWMCNVVCEKGSSKKVIYSKLLHYLNLKDFVYIIPMDENREADGLDLRYRFGYECGVDDEEIEEYLNGRNCSILEMMVALSIKCEEIMEDPDIGDRRPKWFWDMIENLELSYMTDSRFDEDYIDEVIERLLNREYGPDGEGGLFTINNRYEDMREVEIWYQMNWHLNEILY